MSYSIKALKKCFAYSLAGYNNNLCIKYTVMRCFVEYANPNFF